MKKLYAMIFAIIFFLAACTGGGGIAIESIALPEVTEIAYKDIVSCKEMEAQPGYSACRIKDPKSGLAITLKIRTSAIPSETSEPKLE